MKPELSEPELRKGFFAFSKINDQSSEKIKHLESELLKEVRKNGNSNYSTALSNSIQLEEQHYHNSKKQMKEYAETLKAQNGLDSLVNLYYTEFGY